MKKFEYSCIDNEQHLQIENMSLTEAAAQIGYAARSAYSSIYHSDPAAAERFKVAVVMAISLPGSPTWDIESEEGRTAVVVMGPNKE